MDLETISLTTDEGIARVLLNRPAAMNTIDLQLALDLATVTAHLRDASDVRVVVITGAGKAFCAGGDLRSFATESDLPQHLRILTAALHGAIETLAALPVPVVAGVHNVAAGAGMSLACACDLVVATASSRFVLAYAGVGLTPDGSGSWFLPRRVGLGRALELALLNRVLTAQEAEAWGIVTKVVDDDALGAEITAMATQLAAGPTAALGRAKHLLRASSETSLHEQLAHETDALAASAATADGREGISAFTEKRPPSFTGTS